MYILNIYIYVYKWTKWHGCAKQQGLSLHFGMFDDLDCTYHDHPLEVGVPSFHKHLMKRWMIWIAGCYDLWKGQKVAKVLCISIDVCIISIYKDMYMYTGLYRYRKYCTHMYIAMLYHTTAILVYMHSIYIYEHGYGLNHWCTCWSMLILAVIVDGKQTDTNRNSYIIYYLYTYIDTYIHYITLHCITFHYITLHWYIHYITLHYITLHYITLHEYIHACIYTYIT